MESMGAAYTPKTTSMKQMPPQAQSKYLMPSIGNGRMRQSNPMGGQIGGGGAVKGPPMGGGLIGGGGVVKSPRGGSPPWGQSGPGQGGMVPPPMTKPMPPTPKGGGGIQNPRPTPGGGMGGPIKGPIGGFHPLGSAPTMKGPLRGRKF